MAAPPNLNELDPMGLTTHSKQSLHDTHHSRGSQPRLDPESPAAVAAGAPGEFQGSSHQLGSHLGSQPALKAPSEAALQPPPIPREDEVYGDYPEPTTSERIAENRVLVITLGLAAVFWLMVLVSQAYVTANLSNLTIRTAWFGLVLQLVLIVLCTVLTLTTYLPPYHIQLSTLAALVVVFGALAVDANIYAPHTAAQQAVAASWLLTILVDMFWILYFTSPPQSPLTALVVGAGRDPQAQWDIKVQGPASNRNTITGYPSGPTGNRLSRAGSQQGGIELGAVGNRTSVARSNSRPLSNIAESATTVSNSPRGAGTPNEPSRRSGGRWSLYQKHKDKEQQQQLLQQQQGGQRDTHLGVPESVADGESSVGRPDSQAVRKPAVCRAEAMFTYNAGADDPSELSFKKGEILDILDNSGKWWEGRRSDGTVGIVPSNYLRVIG